MAQSESIFVAPLPKALVKFATPIAALLLTTFFILWDFPYHHLTSRVTAALGVEFEAANSRLTVGFDGIGFRFDDVRVELPTGDVYDLDWARVGAGWSPSWLVATPTIFFEIASPIGAAKGSFRMGDDPSGSGSITDAPVGELSFIKSLLPILITGTLSAEAELETSGGEPLGPLSFKLQDGTIDHPDMPIEIPFTELAGRLAFGGEQFVKVEAFDLLGPMLNLSISGKVEHPATNGDRAIDLELNFTDVAPGVRSMVQMLGISVEKDGTLTLEIGGTLDNPSLL
jgi:type II secretion system protein N